MYSKRIFGTPFGGIMLYDSSGAACGGELANKVCPISFRRFEPSVLDLPVSVKGVPIKSLSLFDRLWVVVKELIFKGGLFNSGFI